VNPYEASLLSAPLSGLYADIEDDLLLSIAKRLAKNMEITDTAKWELKMLAQLGALQKNAARIIAQKAGIAPQMLEVALQSAAKDAIEQLEPSYQRLAADGYAKTAKIPPAKSAAQAARAYVKQAKDSLNMVNTVMRYKVKPVWTALIKGVAGYIRENAEKQPVLDLLNKHTGAAVLGAETRQQAVRKCIQEMLDRGIPAFVDKAGREWSPEAYVNMDIRTTVTNTAHAAQDVRMEAYGLDLFAVSSHSGARPKCAKDQGKIFSKSNKSGTVEDLRGNKIRFYPQSSSSIGDPDGLFGINCGHFKTPFVPGVSMQRYFPTEDRADRAENDRKYQESQKQRALERDVRAAKRECAVYDALGDKEAFAKSSLRLREKQKKLASFTQSTGRTRRNDREQTHEFGRSISSKATGSRRRYEQAAQKINSTKTNDGLQTSISVHSVLRAEVRGVKTADIQEALTKPLEISKIKEDSKGRKSKRYIGEQATVAVNPDTGVVTTVWPTSSKLRDKLKGGAR